jgi:hypothetical protein
LDAGFRANAKCADYNKNNIKKQVKDTDPLPARVESNMPAKGAANIRGNTDLQKAISLRPDYDDAMAYPRPLYRRKADVSKRQTTGEPVEAGRRSRGQGVKEINEKRADQPQTAS